MPRTKTLERSIVVNDLHIPNHDKGLVNASLFEFAKEWKPDIIWLNGDIIDNYSVSRYQKRPGQPHFSSELKQVKEFLIALRRAHPKARIVYIFGNHEFRFDSYLLGQAPELYGLVTLSDLLSLGSLRIEVHTSQYRENWVKYKDLYIGHFDCVGAKAGSTAQKLIETRGVSTLQGHIHRFGSSSKTYLDRTIWAYENGTMIDIKKQDYMRRPNWQSGFSLIYALGQKAWVVPVPVKGRQFQVEGQVFSY